MGERINEGTCRFCGQIVTGIPSVCYTQEEADEWATENCACDEGARFRRITRAIRTGCDNVDTLFGRAARDFGFTAVSPETQALLKRLVEAVANGYVSGASIQMGDTNARIVANMKGEIKVLRSQTTKTALEG